MSTTNTITRPVDPNGIPVISMADRLATEARSRRGRYIGALLALANHGRTVGTPEALALLVAELAALDGLKDMLP